jgi:hypothetical protein
MGSCCSQEGRNENVDGGKGKPNDVMLDKEATIEEQASKPGSVPGPGQGKVDMKEESEHAADHKAEGQPDSAQKQDGTHNLTDEEMLFEKEVLNVKSSKEEINVPSRSQSERRQSRTNVDLLRTSHIRQMKSNGFCGNSSPFSRASTMAFGMGPRERAGTQKRTSGMARA